jgi:hypothetical protein
MISDIVKVALIGGLTSTLTAGFAAVLGVMNRTKIGEVHNMVDGNLSKMSAQLAATTAALIDVTDRASEARGIKHATEQARLGDQKYAEGVQAERDRAAAAAEGIQAEKDRAAAAAAALAVTAAKG